MRTFTAAVLLFLLPACMLFRGVRMKEFTCRTEQGYETITLFIPSGYTREKMVLDSIGGKEQFYNYDNGAILYFAKNPGWLTENAPLIHGQKARGSSQQTYK